MKLAIAAACAAPLAACAQTGGAQYGQAAAGPGQQRSAQAQPAQPDLVVITVTPLEQRTMDAQRRESLFRAIDANGDGQVSMAEAGVNTELLQAFRQLDRNGDNSIQREEFARVHVDDGSSASQGRRSSQAPAQSRSSAASGGSVSSVPPAGPSTSPRIDERAIGVQPNLPPQPIR
jgi:hypothetical protein